MFESFDLHDLQIGDTTLRVRIGGAGAPIVLLHGHPRTHTTWHAVAPLLARRHRVVCPDLRGYGRSSKPPTDASHSPYSKRAMAADIVALMSALGHDRFAIVGHDRGSYVAFRAALDHPTRISHLAFLGTVPIGTALAQCRTTFATAWWHWFFFNVPSTPERVINADPEAWYCHPGMESAMGSENYRDLLAAIHDPHTVRAMLEDYRAGLGIDRQHDDEDRRAGRTVRCPTLVLLAARESDAAMYPNIDEIWRSWSTDVTIESIDTGHHMAEEAPAQLAERLDAFVTGAR